ncbi:MAG: sensor histidine kinase [Gammaproteobacteria bacterium]|nr:sensor histidine kinase [Gammaproteobacteria bacterium]
MFTSLFITSLPLNAATIKIGLRAIQGVEKSMEQWKKTADFLSEKIPEHKFVMVPFVGLEELMQATEKNQFDFVLSNPSSYVEMESRFGASAILTLRNKRQGKPYTKFGSVIFTRADSNINEIKDLKGKSIVGVSERAFGGWRVALRELLNEGFNVEKNFKTISFSGGLQQDVVSIVSLGNADVGVVRTDMLERLAQRGDINLDEFKVINKKNIKGFPFLLSTQLYPEWPFAKMRDTSPELSKKVALALLTISSGHPAALAGKYVGWTVPEDYQPVHSLMKELKVGPYLHFHENPYEHFFEEYLTHIIVAIVVFVMLVFTSLYIFTLNRKLYTIKNELEDRVEERTHELLVEKEFSEKANNAKSEFLAQMSHEFRTPLNAVLGFAQLIEHDTNDNELVEINDSANEILIAARHLLGMVSDIMDLTKIESGQSELLLQPIELVDVFTHVLRLLQTKTNAKKITIIFDGKKMGNISVVADLHSLKQVFSNIILNAIKYTPSGGNINIEAEIKNDGYCHIQIIDDGDGIDEEKLSSIFDPFQRVTKRSDVEGSGIGLSICKKLIEAMQGKIIVKSQLNHGSTFTVLLKPAN